MSPHQSAPVSSFDLKLACTSFGRVKPDTVGLGVLFVSVKPMKWWIRSGEKLSVEFCGNVFCGWFYEAQNYAILSPSVILHKPT